MSKPVTNVEIEDVLSSIRRLVSKEAPEEVTPVAPDRPADPAGEDRLVLTDALRVEPVAPVPEAAPPTDLPRWLIPEGEAAAPEAPRTRPARSRIMETIAELEAAVATRAEDYEPEIAESLPRARGADLWPEDPAPAEAPAAREPHPDPVAPTPAPEPEPEPVVFTLHPDRRVTESEPDDVLDEDLENFLDDAPPAVDEAYLRELVAEIVREELRGTLGERITRNVRKLVRREIYRVLSSQDFD